MGRLYVPSTPATRGEPAPKVKQTRGQTSGPVVLTVDDLRAAAAEHGFELVPVKTGPDESSAQGSQQSSPDAASSEHGPEQPAGNASTEKWVEYAKAQGATDADLIGADGQPLNRDELKAKYGQAPTGA